MANAKTELAIRKRMLMARASQERFELLMALNATSQATTHLRGGSGFRWGKSLPLAFSLFRRVNLLRPLMPAVLPMLLAAARKPLVRYGLLGLASAAVAWKGGEWLVQRNGDGSR